jgi:hypothetical protein
MHTIRFPNGRTVPWSEYRKMMLKPRNPGMAYDAKPAWLARDQASGPGGPARFDQVGSGQLARSYVDATNSYLRNAGLSDEDCEVIDAVLQKYVDAGAEDAENLKMPDEQQIRVGGPRGPVGAGDRRLALDERDMFGRPRRLFATAQPLGGDDRGFAARFPGAERIRTV